MDMPGYTDYGKMFEMNPGAFMQAQEQRGLAQQFQAQKQQEAELMNQGRGLDNMFKQDTYGDRLRQGASQADLAGYQASDAGVKNRINTATEGLQLDASQKELIMKASKSELDGMEVMGQRMAYSQDPAERAQGEQLIKMHKDFIKLREQNTFAAGEGAKGRSHQSAMEAQRQAGQASRDAAKAKLKAEAGVGDEKLSTDQLRAKYIGLAQQAMAAGNYEAAAMFQDQARYITDLRASERPDTNVGKIDAPAVANLPAIPPRAPVVPPQDPRGPLSRQLYPEQAPKAPLAPVPSGAVEMLRKNPALAPQFEAKYGPGSAQQYLGK